jgi:FkbM family methyltransferase
MSKFAQLLPWPVECFLIYSRLFRIRDAFVLVLRRKSRGTVAIFSKEVQQRINIRPRTSDLTVARKILDSHEYEVCCDANPRLIIDAGANIGFSALYFAQRYPNAMIYAIEPEEENFRLLKRNCDGRKNILPRRAALWSRRARLDFKDDKAEKWAFAVKESDGAKGGIEAVTIPQILDESGFDAIDILKMDIEGAEKELFSNGCDKWLPKVRILIIELHDRVLPGCSDAFYSALRPMQFSREDRGENVIIYFPGK